VGANVDLNLRRDVSGPRSISGSSRSIETADVTGAIWAEPRPVLGHQILALVYNADLPAVAWHRDSPQSAVGDPGGWCLPCRGVPCELGWSAGSPIYPRQSAGAGLTVARGAFARAAMLTRVPHR